MNPLNPKLENNLKIILKILPHKILDFSENGNITEEDIYNIALNLRNSEKVPFYPRSIGLFEAYSIDIHYCIKILEAIDFLDQVDNQIANSKTFIVNSYIGNNIDVNQILCEKKILELCATKLEDESFEYSSKICDKYFNFLEKEENYLFTHLGCLDQRFNNQIDLIQIGIDNFKDLTSFGTREKINKRGYEEEVLSKLGEKFLSHCNNLPSYNIFITSLKKAYSYKKEKIEGKLVLIIGIFDEYDRIPENYLYEFRDSIIFDANHKIQVLFREKGFLCEKSALIDRECLLLGFVDYSLGEVALRAAGVIKIDSKHGSVPAQITVPKIHTSKQTTPLETVVRETTGEKTTVEKTTVSSGDPV